MIQAGLYNYLTISRFTSVGAYLDDGAKGLLLPKRFVPAEAKPGDVLKVFVYHDSENRLIATTHTPKAIAGDIARLTVVSVTPQGAFLDNGLMKDLFVPKSQQVSRMLKNGRYIVRVFIDERTGRMAATEKFDHLISNEELTVQEKEQVDLLIYRQTDLGYAVIINNKHEGLLYFNEVFRNIEIGDTMEGFIKKIYPDNKIDVMTGKAGFEKTEEEGAKILRLLQENAGYLPYYDKSDPKDIYDFFGMSKKTFKMTIGTLYKQRKISLEQTGIKLVDG